MRTPTGLTAVQAISAVSVVFLILATVWLVAVPSVVTPLTFVTAAGLIAAVIWIGKITYQNGQSTESIGQVLYDTEQAPASKNRSSVD